jgi:hypothetical protein
VRVTRRHVGAMRPEGKAQKVGIYQRTSAPLCQAALREGACESAIMLLKTASQTRLLRHRSASLRDLGLPRMNGRFLLTPPLPPPV